MSGAAVTVRVPASSANLGPGFDCFAAALGLQLTLTVDEGEFAIETDLAVPRDRSNLVVAGFERVRPADGHRFVLRSDIPLSGGLGSSAAATLAGLLAARALSGEKSLDVLALAAEIEGHPDNAAASMLGGIVVYADGELHRIDPPAGLATFLVVPFEGVATSAARAALPATVPLADAVANTAHGALLMLGLASGDLDLVARGLRDRLHEPYRAHLYQRSADLVAAATGLGALGATISGAGPTVLVWVRDGAAPVVEARLRDRTHGWAAVLPARFEAHGAEVLA